MSNVNKMNSNYIKGNFKAFSSEDVCNHLGRNYDFLDQNFAYK